MLNKVPIFCLLGGENIRLINNFSEIWEIKYCIDLRYIMNMFLIKRRVSFNRSVWKGYQFYLRHNVNMSYYIDIRLEGVFVNKCMLFI